MVVRLSRKYAGCPMFDDVPLSFWQVRRFCEQGCCSRCPDILIGYLNKTCRDEVRVREYAAALEDRLVCVE